MGEHEDHQSPKKPTPSRGQFGAVFRAARRRSAAIPRIVQRTIDAERRKSASDPDDAEDG